MDFHPLAAKYPLMDDDQIQEMVSDMKEHGYDPNFPIVRHEGKILAGRNRFRAAKLAKVKPKIIELPKGIDPQVFVRRENELRNHYTQEVLATLRTERIERVAHAAANGASQRKIAEQEGISRAQVQRDIDEAVGDGAPTTDDVAPGEHGIQKGQTKENVAPPGQKRQNGVDKENVARGGQKRQKESLIPELAGMVLSPRLVPLLEDLPKKAQEAVLVKIRDGMNPRQALDHVTAVQATAAMDKEIKDERDQLGFAIPTKALKDIFADTFLQDCMRQIDAMICGCKSAARWAKYLLFADIYDSLQSVRTKFDHAIPHAVHQPCKGKGCKDCRDGGYVPKWRHEELEHQRLMEDKS